MYVSRHAKDSRSIFSAFLTLQLRARRYRLRQSSVANCDARPLSGPNAALKSLTCQPKSPFPQFHHQKNAMLTLTISQLQPGAVSHGFFARVRILSEVTKQSEQYLRLLVRERGRLILLPSFVGDKPLHVCSNSPPNPTEILKKNPGTHTRPVASSSVTTQKKTHVVRRLHSGLSIQQGTDPPGSLTLKPKLASESKMRRKIRGA